MCGPRKVLNYTGQSIWLSINISLRENTAKADV
jgi:hypothetical protein